MSKVVSLGEILLRLSPPNYQTLIHSRQFDCQFGGSELNVLATLAQLGHQVSLITALPDNDLGKMAESFLFTRQINQEYIIKMGERLGVYYYQKGFSLRASRVTYDRKYSSFWQSTIEDYKLADVFSGADWFHVSGITAALTPELYKLTELLMKQAKAQGLKVSFDLNFRASLWESFEQARQVLSNLVVLADVCVGLEPIALPTENGQDYKDQLALKPPYASQEILVDVVEKIAKRYQLEALAFTQREMGHTNEYVLKGYLYYAGQLFETDKEGIQVLDRVGTGDAFTAGIIYGFLEKKEAQEILDIAMASFKFKHTIDGDINSITKQDIANLLSKQSHEIKR